MKNASKALGSQRTLVPAAFRVIARLKGHSRAIVSFARTRPHAVRMAREFSDAVLGHRNSLAARGRRSNDRVRVVVVEEWVGTILHGEWKRLPVHQGGFAQALKPDNSQGPSAKFGSGTHVECVLLLKRTHKGGWRARLRKGKLAGPVTNTVDVPVGLRPGQPVTLRIGTLSGDGKRIQFDWLPDSAEPTL